MDSTPASPSLPTASHPSMRWESLKAEGASAVRNAASLAVANGLRPQNQPGGFAWSRPARPHSSATAAPIVKPATDDGADPTVLRLMTLHSDNPSDSATYRMDEHFRRMWDTRKLLFMHPHDMVARGLVEGDLAHVTTVSNGEQGRELAGMRVVPFDLPRGSVGGYFSECNPLLSVPPQAPTSPLHAAANISVRVKNATA